MSGHRLEGDMPNPFEWSTEMDAIFWNSIGKVIQDDPRTDWSENLSLGYPFELIREEVLAKGLADFSTGHDHAIYGSLTAEEKVLLYCFVNLKRHFFACLATYEVHRTILQKVLDSESPPLLVDVGCGPATACLAFAELKVNRRFDYLGIDQAPTMRSRANALWESARTRGLIDKDSKATFVPSWSDYAEDNIGAEVPVIVIFSYFFASHTLTLAAIVSLARFVNRLTKTRTSGNSTLVYLNSSNPLANRNYEIFKQQLGIEPATAVPDKLTIEFRKRKGGPNVGKEEFVHELIQLQAGET
jgi:SAM-dependent methyltransferase